MTKRNDTCPCGSGKKYKNCCLLNKLEAERQKVAPNAVIYDTPEEETVPGIATWKIVLAVTAILGIISLLVAFVIDAPRAAGSIFGCGMLILIVYAAFRNVPSVRRRPGDAGNIDFGNRS